MVRLKSRTKPEKVELCGCDESIKYHTFLVYVSDRLSTLSNTVGLSEYSDSVRNAFKDIQTSIIRVLKIRKPSTEAKPCSGCLALEKKVNDIVEELRGMRTFDGK